MNIDDEPDPMTLTVLGVLRQPAPEWHAGYWNPAMIGWMLELPDHDVLAHLALLNRAGLAARAHDGWRAT